LETEGQTQPGTIEFTEMNGTDKGSLTINSVESTTPKVRQAARLATNWDDGTRTHESGVRSSLFGEPETMVDTDGAELPPNSQRSVNVLPETPSFQGRTQVDQRVPTSADETEGPGSQHDAPEASGLSPSGINKRAKLQPSLEGNTRGIISQGSSWQQPPTSSASSDKRPTAPEIPPSLPARPTPTSSQPGLAPSTRPPIDAERLMPFGKYKGRPLSELPAQYLAWLRASVPTWPATERLLTGRPASPSPPSPPPADAAPADDGSVGGLFARWGLPRRGWASGASSTGRWH
jgi:hypothetical protein